MYGIRVFLNGDMSELPQSVARKCEGLCWDESEMQGHFRSIGTRDMSAVPDMRLAVASLDDDCWTPIGWASVYGWHGMPQLQTFVDEKYRMRGLSTALCAAVLFDLPTRDGALAVFDEGVYRIVTRLGWQDVRLYKRVSDGWINVGYRCRNCGADSGRLHVDAPEVCGMPLAGGEEGALA